MTSESSPVPRSLPPIAFGVILTLALCKLLVHLYAGRHYGYFIDELYYLACSRHLDWGYVDQPPLIALVTLAARSILGDSLPAIRFLPALAGVALVVMTAMIARELGGGRFAQGLAALATLCAPGILGIDNLLSMNAFEPLFWMGCAWLLIRIANTGNQRLWVWFGVLAGLGLENKYSMLIFGAGIATGLILTPLRRSLASPWIWVGGAIAFLLFLPNLLWNIQHQFPFLEIQANIRRHGRDVALGPVAFFAQEILTMGPLTFPIWLSGLWFLFAGGRLGPRRSPEAESSSSGAPRIWRKSSGLWKTAFSRSRLATGGNPAGDASASDAPRALGWAWVFTASVIVTMSPRVYYLYPAFPLLFAAGGVAWERRLRSGAPAWRRLAYPALLVITSAMLAPIAIPVLPRETYIRYTGALHIGQPKIETHRLGPLPQLFADQFGWEGMAEVVARVYNSLPAEIRPKTAIFGQNYGQAGAIDLFGPKYGLPSAISGHQNYFLWGPRGYTGESMIVMGGERQELERQFAAVQKVGRAAHPYSMPYEQIDLFYCQGLKKPLSEVWPSVKAWD